MGIPCPILHSLSANPEVDEVPAGWSVLPEMEFDIEGEPHAPELHVLADAALAVLAGEEWTLLQSQNADEADATAGMPCKDSPLSTVPDFRSNSVAALVPLQTG